MNLSPFPIQRLLFACMITFSATVVSAALVFEYDATLDTPGDGIWQDEVGSQDVTFNNGNTSPASISGSSYFNKAYEFGGSTIEAGTGDDALWKNLGASGASGASYEIWFRADGLKSLNQVLITNGGTGKGFSLSLGTDGSILALAKDSSGSNPDLNLNSTSLLSTGEDIEFTQIVLTINENGTNTVGSLYINGLLDGSQTINLSNFAYDGGAAGGFADRINTDVGGVHPDNTVGLGGRDDVNSTFTNLTGDIALVRMYDTALTAGDVSTLYGAVIPEPSTMFLALGGLLATLVFSRRRSCK
ncbi:PEP-CTERM sorting domain-containing protein [Kiritimatiellota bacterium B12222]|nr:PEP-CTERM sorting domain-containing protein [Kiritimatiellota bacterium B12222]